MVLADTSVWVDFLRGRSPIVTELLENDSVFMHPFIAGELACGNLKDRSSFLRDLCFLPQSAQPTDEECRRVLEVHKLWGLGIGWIDIHLLASALLSDCELWTLDGALQRAARQAGTKLRA